MRASLIVRSPPNGSSTTSPKLSLRLDVIEVEGPSIDDFDILVLWMTAELARLWAVPLAAMPALPPAALDALEAAFEPSGLTRQIKRQLEVTLGILVAHLPRRIH